MSRFALLTLFLAATSLGCATKLGDDLGAKRKGVAGARPAEEKADQDKQGKEEKAGEKAARKVVYKADLEVIVEDLDQAEARLLALLEERGGRVDQADV